MFPTNDKDTVTYLHITLEEEQKLYGHKTTSTPTKGGESQSFGVWGVGGDANVSIGIRVDINYFYVWDTHGNHGLLRVYEFGGGTPAIGIGAVQFYNSDAETIYDLEGWGADVGGSIGPLGGDWTPSRGQLGSGSVSAGKNWLPVPFEFHVTATYSRLVKAWATASNG